MVAPKFLSRGLLLIIMEQISSDSVWCYVVRWILVTGCCWWGRAVFWQSHNFKVVLRGSFVCVPGPGRLNANNEPWEAPGIRKLIRFIIFVFFSWIVDLSILTSMRHWPLSIYIYYLSIHLFIYIYYLSRYYKFVDPQSDKKWWCFLDVWIPICPNSVTQIDI